jgi:hypothetical protein
VADLRGVERIDLPVRKVTDNLESTERLLRLHLSNTSGKRLGVEVKLQILRTTTDNQSRKKYSKDL